MGTKERGGHWAVRGDQADWVCAVSVPFCWEEAVQSEPNPAARSLPGSARAGAPCRVAAQAVPRGAGRDGLHRPRPSSAAGLCRLSDRPWERASPGPEGTVARPRPHIIAIITGAIGTINNSGAILLTAGSKRQEVQQPPALGGPGDLDSASRPEAPGLPRPHWAGRGQGRSLTLVWDARLWPQLGWRSCPRPTRSAAGHGLGEDGEGIWGVRLLAPILRSRAIRRSRGLGCPHAGSCQGKSARLVQRRLSFPARSPSPYEQARALKGRRVPGTPQSPCHSSCVPEGLSHLRAPPACSWSTSHPGLGLAWL